MTHSKISQVAESDFEAEVLRSPGPVLVEFSATWCGPCKAQLPVLEALATERSTKLKVVAIDIDAAPRLASRYGVKGAPTTMVFRHGTVTARNFGLAHKNRLLEMVDA